VPGPSKRPRRSSCSRLRPCAAFLRAGLAEPALQSFPAFAKHSGVFAPEHLRPLGEGAGVHLGRPRTDSAADLPVRVPLRLDHDIRVPAPDRVYKGRGGYVGTAVIATRTRRAPVAEQHGELRRFRSLTEVDPRADGLAAEVAECQCPRKAAVLPRELQLPSECAGTAGRMDGRDPRQSRLERVGA
jgi:hypothetical protein